jgi:glycosyltransferase involved in cell wall biosynthesis
MIFAVSEAVKKKYSEALKPKIEVIYNGFKEKNVSGEKWNSINKFQLYIVGRIMYTKGQLELIKAISLLDPKDLERCEIHIIGSIYEHDYMMEIKSIIEANCLNDIVKFDGYVENVVDKMSEAHCICVCSKKEAFARVTVEGMLNKCVVIGANTGGTVELITNNETGLLYQYGNEHDLAEKISFCINNPKICSHIADNAFCYAKANFMMDNEYKKVVKMYKEILMRLS